jgi:predicted transcriptional regulator YdeE
MKELYLQIGDPEFSAHPLPFRLVGYPFEAESGLSTAERGAYWQGKQFPPFDAEEYAKIGGGPAEIGVWTREGEREIYVFGYVVPEIGFVPATMRAVTIPGGEFMIFRAPAYKEIGELGENLRATWRYAYEQWLPGSDYEVDQERVPFEYYLESNSLVYVPVKKKVGKA